jgi:hypothetical protein
MKTLWPQLEPVLGDEAVPVDARSAEAIWLEAELAAQPPSLRPLDVVRSFGAGVSERTSGGSINGFRATALGGSQFAALPDATGAPHALVRAS